MTPRAPIFIPRRRGAAKRQSGTVRERSARLSCFEITLVMYVCFVLRAVIRAALAAFQSCPPVCHVHLIFVFYGQIWNECGACH